MKQSDLENLFFRVPYRLQARVLRAHFTGTLVSFPRMCSLGNKGTVLAAVKGRGHCKSSRPLHQMLGHSTPNDGGVVDKAEVACSVLTKLKVWHTELSLTGHPHQHSCWAVQQGRQPISNCGANHHSLG